MSLSRSEEMHRLTENVYKVSFQRGPECAPESSGPSWPPAGRLPDCGCGGPIFGCSQVAAPAQGPYARRGPRGPGARVGAPTPTAPTAPARARSPQYACLPRRPEGPSGAGLGCSATRSGPLHPGVREQGAGAAWGLQTAAVGRPALAWRGGTAGLS